MQNLLVTPYYFSSKYSALNCPFRGNKVADNEIPDLKQYDLPNVGEYFCAPVSVADGIISLSKKGFPQLYKQENSTALINELASYFKTDEKGTTTNNMCLGLESFINSKGYNSNIKYQGFRPTEQKYHTTLIPDLNWIKQEMDKQNAVILNLGVYKKTTQNGKTVYKRQYGHFVLATGKNTNGVGIDPNYLSIHDPYDRVKGNHYIKTSSIAEGKFIHNSDDNEKVLTDNAKGFIEIPTKFNYFSSDEVAVIDGAISLEIKK